MKSFLAKAVDNLDITLAVLGCVLAIPLTIYLQSALRQPVYTTVGVIVFVAFVAYLLIRRRSAASVGTQAEAAPRLYLLLNILFFGLLTYSILAFHLRPEIYTRPLGYFTAMAAMAAILAVEILFLPPRKSATYLALFKVIVIGLSLVWSQMLIYPTVVGVDPWYHQWFTGQILEAGQIPSGYWYSHLPGMHLLTGATSLVTGLDYRMATMLSGSLLQVVCTALFIFLLGRFIHSAKAGLLAALFLVIADYFVRFAYWTIPNGVAVALIPMVVYLMFKLRQEKPAASVCLAVVLMGTAILTHSIGALMLAVVLAFLWLGLQAYNRLRYRAAAGARIFLVALLLFSGATLSYWTFVSGHTRIITGLVQAGFGGEYFGTLPPGAVDPPPGAVDPPPGAVDPPPEELPALHRAVAQYRDSLPFTERLFNQLGFFLFFAFAFIGSLALLSRRLRNRYGFALVMAGLLILAVNFFGIVTHRGFIESRWSHLSQVLLAIPVGMAFLWLAGLPGRRIASACLIAIIAFVLSFLMIISPQANQDNLTFSPNTIVRYALTQSEATAANSVSSLYSGNITVDRNYGQLRFLPDFDGRIVNTCNQLYSGNFTAHRGTLVLLREEVVLQPFRIAGGVYRLHYDPGEALTGQGFSRIYESGSVSGFLSMSQATSDDPDADAGDL